ncbi:MAG: hypothetical protein ACFFEX_00550 [Candidatus Thorarchaeota archaeon]
MKHINTRIILGVAIAFAFLMGSLVTPVAALQSQIAIEKYNQAFHYGTNNHTYLYLEPDPLDHVSRATIHLNEDLDYYRYSYDNTGWARAQSSGFEPANSPFYWMNYQGFATGTYGNPTRLPNFYDFTASDGSGVVVNTTLETRTFSLAFGQHTPVMVERDSVYYGTLPVTGQEFVHLTIDCRQDDVGWSVSVVDPEGRFMASTIGSEGDIVLIPFNPSIDGTYIVILQATPGSTLNTLFDIFPTAVSPQRIGIDEVVTGELPTGEIVINDETGSLVHKELAPTAHTYKFWSPDSLASISYSYNYPEMFPGITQPPAIFFTSDSFEYGYDGGSRYVDAIEPPTSGVYNYIGDTHYVTVMGGDNVEYTLYHRAIDESPLPVNQEFQIENYFSTTDTRAYRLTLEEDSILRVNSTAVGVNDFVIRIVAEYEDGYRVERSITDANTLAGATDYYLPAGDYMVEIGVASGVNEWIEFNLGPITTEAEASIVRLGGFFVPTSVFQLYNLSLYLDNHDNVTVSLEITVRDLSDLVLANMNVDLANWWDGSSLMTNPSDPNNVTYMLGSRIWHEGLAFVGICAYDVANNTVGATNHYQDYPVNLTIEWVNRLSTFYDDTTSLDVASAVDSYNFTLPLPADSVEYYGVDLNTTKGTWYNVSIRTGEITTFEAILFSEVDGRSHDTAWSDLSVAQTGSLPDISFQFGAISDVSHLRIYAVRNLGTDGFLWIQITPMVTQLLELPEISPVGPDILAILGSIALPVGLGVGVIVVVYVIYVKKFKD